MDDTVKYWRGRDGKYHQTAGTNNRFSKLDDDTVRTIKYGRSGITNVAVAKEFGIGAQYVSQIRNGYRWAHIRESD